MATILSYPDLRRNNAYVQELKHGRKLLTSVEGLIIGVDWIRRGQLLERTTSSAGTLQTLILVL